ncbi:AsmA family protein [Iodobacter arcticus]|uniref:AsmA family protein n=1 Tax=Iodobacter arcticus TaxID=590593 RepID=A0ABW2R0X3_9NEIS
MHRPTIDWRHSRPFRICLLLLVMLVTLLGTLPYFISFDLIKSELSGMLEKDTKRQLTIRGDARFVLLPQPALLLDNVTLTEPGEATIFSHADRVRVELSLWPLLIGKGKIKALDFEKPELNVIRREDGTYNFEDLLTPKAQTKELSFSLDTVHFTEAAFKLSDEFLGESLRISRLNLTMKNLSDPKAGRLDLDGMLLIGDSNRPVQWQGSLNATAAMRYHEADNRLLFADLMLELEQKGGSSPELRLQDVKVSAVGNLVYGWQPLRFNGGELKLSASGQRAGQNWKGELDVPEIIIAKDALNLNRLKLNVDMQSPSGQLSAKATIPKLAGLAQGLLRTETASFEVKLNSPEQNLALSFASPLELLNGSIARLPAYRLIGSYTNRNLPRGAIGLDLNGAGTLNLQAESLSLNSQGQLDKSPVKAQIEVKDFVRPHYAVDVDLNKLDLSPYLPVVAAGAKTVNPDKPFDFWWLNNLDASGKLKIGELAMQKLHINDISLEFAAKNRKLNLNPLAANLYEGQLTGSLEVDASKKSASFRVQQKLANMNINALLADAIDTSRFEGRGHLDLDVSAVGNQLSDLRRTAGGNVRLLLNQGAVRGIDLEALLRTASRQISLMNGEARPSLNLEAKTSFSELRSTLVLKHGVASNNDLSVTAGILKLNGGGTLDLNSNAINYSMSASANPKVPELKGLSGLTLPIQLSGALNAPEYHIDYASLKEQILLKQKAASETQAAEAAAKRKALAQAATQKAAKAAADKKAADAAAKKTNKSTPKKTEKPNK